MNIKPLSSLYSMEFNRTQTMAMRNGIQDNEWVRRTEQQIGDLRDLVTNGTVSHPTPPPVRPTPVSADAGSATRR